MPDDFDLSPVLDSIDSLQEEMQNSDAALSDQISMQSDSIENLQESVNLLAAQINANTYGGNFNSTVLGIFDRCQGKIPATADYVAYREGANSYVLVWGDLDYNNGKFTGTVSDGLRCSQSGGAGSYYQLATVSTGAFTLSPSYDVVYSNLGNYPVLDGGGGLYLAALFGAVVIGLLGSAIWKWFKFTLRGGSDNGLSAGGGGSYRAYD